MKTNSLRALSLCVMAALVSAPACVSGGAASDSQVCADAAAHVEACIPGYQARVATSCDGAAQAHAEDVLGASCDSLLTQVYPQAQIFRTKGLGHTRILKDESVIHRCVDFLQEN